MQRYQLIKYFAIFYILRFHPESSLTCWEIKTEAPGQSPLNGGNFYTIQACKLLFPQTDSTSKTFTPTHVSCYMVKKGTPEATAENYGGRKKWNDKKTYKRGFNKKDVAEKTTFPL